MFSVSKPCTYVGTENYVCTVIHGLYLSQGASGMFLSSVWCNSMHSLHVDSEPRLRSGCVVQQRANAARTPWGHYVFDFELIFGCCRFRDLLLFSNILGPSHSVIRAHIGAQISIYGAVLLILSENYLLRCVALILGAKMPSAEIIVNLSVRVNCKFSVPAEKPCRRVYCRRFPFLQS